MNFDLSPEQSSLQARARDVASTVVQPVAAEVDATGVVPPTILDAVATLGLRGGAFEAVVVLEELAVASAPVAAVVGLGVASASAAGLAGLRGVPSIETPSDRQHLTMAAVCVGIGRAAIGEALRAARARGDRPMGEPGDPPHWALADAATEVDAARLLLHAAAAGEGSSGAAVLVFAAGAATRAVDAALRVVGPEGYRPGTVLERCARDARSASMVLGSDDRTRQAAADALLS